MTPLLPLATVKWRKQWKRHMKTSIQWALVSSHRVWGNSWPGQAVWPGSPNNNYCYYLNQALASTIKSNWQLLLFKITKKATFPPCIGLTEERRERTIQCTWNQSCCDILHRRQQQKPCFTGCDSEGRTSPRWKGPQRRSSPQSTGSWRGEEQLRLSNFSAVRLSPLWTARGAAPVPTLRGCHWV